MRVCVRACVRNAFFVPLSGALVIGLFEDFFLLTWALFFLSQDNVNRFFVLRRVLSKSEHLIWACFCSWAFISEHFYRPEHLFLSIFIDTNNQYDTHIFNKQSPLTFGIVFSFVNVLLITSYRHTLFFALSLDYFISPWFAKASGNNTERTSAKWDLVRRNTMQKQDLHIFFLLF